MNSNGSYLVLLIVCLGATQCLAQQLACSLNTSGHGFRNVTATSVLDFERNKDIRDLSKMKDS